MWNAIERRPGGPGRPSACGSSPRLPTRASLPTGVPAGACRDSLSTGAATLRAEPPTRAHTHSTTAPESQHHCEMPPTTKAPEGRSPRPRAPRLVAVPCPVLCVYRTSAKRGDRCPGTAARAGRASPAATLNPCRRVNVNTFPLLDLVGPQAAAGRRQRRWASAATVARETLSSRARDQTLPPSILLRPQAPGGRRRVGRHGMGPRTSRAAGCEGRTARRESRSTGCQGRTTGCKARPLGGEVRSPDREGRAAGCEGGAPGRERGAAACDGGAAACGKGSAGPQIDLGGSKRLDPDPHPVEGWRHGHRPPGV